MLSDGELLRRYVEEGSEPAFTELVQRHVSMVYLAALRRVGRNTHVAEDVTQTVFTDLARKARSLQAHPSLAGWLHTGTRFAAAQAVRTERRRRVREQEAQTMHEFDPPSSVSTDRLEPFLDEVMDLLNEQDRDAVLLHFFEGRTFAEVGAILSLSADATRMRVSRALERLRTKLARRGIVSSASALAAMLSAQSALAVPASLALSVTRHALSHAGASHAAVSLAARLVQAAKSFSFTSWVGLVLVMGTAGFAFYSLKTARPAAGPSLADSGPATVPVPPAKGIPDSAEAVAPDFAPASADRSSPVAGGPANPSSVASDFGQLSVEEKNILAKLWDQRNLAPPPTGGRWGLQIGPRAPNFIGCTPLLAKGLINISEVKKVVYLNEMGMAFCEAHAEEIDSYQINEYKKSGVARRSPDR
ncbi:MAG TPA: sigma-70 family RNA polymerase sigma factor [Opitutaceae bacterium]|nr:sigma-70 family RNA polymerase sigma factor [Opitutaceae bacterium]